MIKAIIFDKDGTLLSLGPSWDEPSVVAFDKLMAMSDLTADQIDAYREEIGIIDGRILPNTLFSAGSVIEQAQAFVDYVPMSEEELVLFLEDEFLSHVKKQNVKENVIDGAHAMLAELKQDYILGLVTNDQKRITQEMLTNAELLDYFDFVGCADEYQPKPNPGALHALAEEFDVSLDEMIYVGDSSVDMIYSQHIAGGIGVAFTPEDREHVSEADYIVEDLSQIPRVIEQMQEVKREQN